MACVHPVVWWPILAVVAITGTVTGTVAGMIVGTVVGGRVCRHDRPGDGCRCDRTWADRHHRAMAVTIVVWLIAALTLAAMIGAGTCLPMPTVAHIVAIAVGTTVVAGALGWDMARTVRVRWEPATIPAAALPGAVPEPTPLADEVELWLAGRAQ